MTARVTFDTNQWAFPQAGWLRLTNLLDGGSFTLDLSAGSNSVPLTLQANECIVCGVQSGPPPRPLLRLDPWTSGASSTPVSLDIIAWPGLITVVEASTDLVTWVSRQTNAVPDTGSVHFEDSNPVTQRQFYRARLQ